MNRDSKIDDYSKLLPHERMRKVYDVTRSNCTKDVPIKFYNLMTVHRDIIVSNINDILCDNPMWYFIYVLKDINNLFLFIRYLYGTPMTINTTSFIDTSSLRKWIKENDNTPPSIEPPIMSKLQRDAVANEIFKILLNATPMVVTDLLSPLRDTINENILCIFPRLNITTIKKHTIKDDDIPLYKCPLHHNPDLDLEHRNNDKTDFFFLNASCNVCYNLIVDYLRNAQSSYYGRSIDSDTQFDNYYNTDDAQTPLRLIIGKYNLSKETYNFVRDIVTLLAASKFNRFVLEMYCTNVEKSRIRLSRRETNSVIFHFDNKIDQDTVKIFSTISSAIPITDIHFNFIIGITDAIESLNPPLSVHTMYFISQFVFRTLMMRKYFLKHTHIVNFVCHRDNNNERGPFNLDEYIPNWAYIHWMGQFPAKDSISHPMKQVVNIYRPCAFVTMEPDRERIHYILTIGRKRDLMLDYDMLVNHPYYCMIVSDSYHHNERPIKLPLKLLFTNFVKFNKLDYEEQPNFEINQIKHKLHSLALNELSTDYFDYTDYQWYRVGYLGRVKTEDDKTTLIQIRGDQFINIDSSDSSSSDDTSDSDGSSDDDSDGSSDMGDCIALLFEKEANPVEEVNPESSENPVEEEVNPKSRKSCELTEDEINEYTDTVFAIFLSTFIKPQTVMERFDELCQHIKCILRNLFKMTKADLHNILFDELNHIYIRLNKERDRIEKSRKERAEMAKDDDFVVIADADNDEADADNDDDDDDAYYTFIKNEFDSVNAELRWWRV